MKKNWMMSILLISGLALAFLAGCGAKASALTESATVAQSSTGAPVQEDSSETVNQAEAPATENESAVVVPISAEGSTINLSDYGDNAAVTIDAAGEYVISGTLTNGQVVINVGDDDLVQLYLNNASITNNSGSVIVVANAGEVVITLVEGTANTVVDGSTYTNLDENGEPDAAIFSHDDLTINGTGSLTVLANYTKGIESRDDFKISGGTISVNAVGSGLFGNNTIEIEAADLVITAGVDSIHSDGDIVIESGSLTINSGDDGIHADGMITINGGTIDIQTSYEGIEATDVVINDANITILANDDGINGAGGNDNSGNAGMGPIDFFSSSSASITINGGTIMITAGTSGNGDGLDANGSITITGGDTVIVQPASYRDYSNIDFNTTFSLTGGNVRILETNGTYTEVTEDSISAGPGFGGGGGGRGH